MSVRSSMSSTNAMPGRTTLSLRLRLGLLVAAVVAIVIAAEGYLEIATFERDVEQDIMEDANATARAVAGDIEIGQIKIGPDASAPDRMVDIALGDYLKVNPTLRDIAILMRQGDGRLVSAGRTSVAPMDDVLPAAEQAMIRRGRFETIGTQERMVAEPVMRGQEAIGAVTVTISLALIDQLGSRGRQVTLWFAIPAVLILTFLVDLLARRLVHRPIEAIRGTMRKAGTGDLEARAPIARPDEIGDVASGLNDMLAQLELLQAHLQARVEDATRELRDTNARLVESYQRVLGLRGALARAEQLAALGQMAANVAHQIGTPLNLVSGYVQLLAQEAPADTRTLDRLRTIEVQIRKVIDAVRTMLDSSRRPGLQREMVDVAALVEQVCELSRPALHAAQVDVEVKKDAPLPPVQADPVQLELALLNLVSNSLDAMPGGGRIIITLAPEAEGIRVSVADTGTGIPAEMLSRIFDPWVTTKGTGHGTGLGLSITREAIAAHGGTIEVESEPDRGTVFTIHLQATAPAAHTADVPQPTWLES